LLGLVITGLVLYGLYRLINAAHLPVVAVVVVMGVIGTLVISHRRLGFLVGALVGAVVGVPLSHVGLSHSHAASGHSGYPLSHTLISAAVTVALGLAAFYFMGLRTFRADGEKREQ
jgi:hypothetical protein